MKCFLPFFQVMSLVLLSCVGPAAIAQQLPSLAPSNHSLREVLNPDGTIKTGAKGSFDATGFRLSSDSTSPPSFVTTGTGDDDWDGKFAEKTPLNGSVRTVAVASNGDIIAGGTFTDAGGNADADRIARWDGSAWQAFGTGLNGQVNAIVINPSGIIYAGGAFTDAGGVTTADYVASWNPAAATPAWTNLSVGCNNPVRALAITAAGQLVAAGEFTLAGGIVNTARVARWTGTAWVALGTGITTGNVLAIAVPPTGSDIVAVGTFTGAGGVANTGYIAHWTGSAWVALGTGSLTALSGVALAVNAVAMTSATNIVVGGDFQDVNGVTNTLRIARWTGSAWQAVGTGLNNSVRRLAFNGTASTSDFYAVGDFTLANNVANTNRIARWSNTNSNWLALGTGLSSTTQGLFVLTNGDVVAGGIFQDAGGYTSADYIARYSPSTWQPLSAAIMLGNATTPTVPVVHIVAVASNDDIIVGGDFLNVAGISTCDNIARWNGTAWQNMGSGCNSAVRSITVVGTDIIVGGDFTLAGGVANTVRIARWNGSAWQPLGTGMTGGSVLALASAGTDIVAVGTFSAAGGVANTGRIARWDGSAWQALGNGTVTALSGVTLAVNAVAMTSTSNVVVGGDFQDVNGVANTLRIARWDGSAWQALGTGVNNSVRGLAFTSNGDFIAVGDFLDAGGNTSADRIARWVTATSTWQALNTGLNATTRTVAVAANGDIFAGGTFLDAGGNTSADRIARWTGSAWQNMGTGTNDAVRAIAVRAPVAGNTNSAVAAGGLFTAVGDGSKVMQRFGIYNTPPNQAPVIAAQTFTIDENSANGTAVGNVVATDADAGTTLTYTLLSGNTSGAFSLSSTGALQVANVTALDFETTPTFTLSVRVSDGTLTSMGTVTVSLNDVAESLTVSTTRTIPAGNYSNVFITSTGVATLAGNVSVTGVFNVASGGSLADGCFVITGNSFVLNANATLYICNPDGISFGSSGTVRTTSRAFVQDASYVYNGTVAQVTGNALPLQVRNLSVDNAAGLTLSRNVTVNQVLTLGGAGDLRTNGFVLLLPSTATGTALVVNSGTGVVVGSSTVQRATTTGATAGPGYRHYSPPVSNTATNPVTVDDLATAGFTPIFNTLYNSSATPGAVTPFPTVYGYDQSRLATSPATTLSEFDKGWFSPAAGDNMQVGRGYTVNIDAAQTVALDGTLNTGDYSVALTRLAGNADAGWHLVGNPYPAPLDWSLVLPADRPNLTGSMYVFESSSQYGGNYRSYTNGIGSGDPLIASGQGFFVQVNNGQTSGSLNFHNSQRRTSYADQATFRRGTTDTRPQIQLTLQGAGRPDAAFVYAEAGATTGLDAEFDAVKLPNPDGLNLACLTATGQDLAINGLPALLPTTVVPLRLTVPAAGTYTVTAADLLNLPTGLRPYLLDATTGQLTPLSQQSTYSLVLPAGTTTRLSLVFQPALVSSAATALMAAQVKLYPNPARKANQVTVQLSLPAGTTAATATVLNALGQVVVSPRMLTVQAGEATGSLPTSGLAAGVYTVRLTAGAAVLTKRLVIE